MKKIFILLVAFGLFMPGLAYSLEACGPDKILGTTTINAKLKEYIIEDASNMPPSHLIFTVNGKELWIIADPEEIEKISQVKKASDSKLPMKRYMAKLATGVMNMKD